MLETYMTKDQMLKKTDSHTMASDNAGPHRCNWAAMPAFWCSELNCEATWHDHKPAAFCYPPVASAWKKWCSSRNT